ISAQESKFPDCIPNSYTGKAISWPAFSISVQESKFPDYIPNSYTGTANSRLARPIPELRIKTISCGRRRTQYFNHLARNLLLVECVQPYLGRMLAWFKQRQ